MKKILDVLRGKRPAATATPPAMPSAAAPAVITQPQARVLAFIADWHTQWQHAQQRMGRNVDFAVWGALVDAVDGRHFSTGSSSATQRAFGSQPDFDPARTDVLDCVIDGANAQVHTRRHGGPVIHYHVHDLLRGQDGDWRIRSIFTLFDPPRSPVISAERATELRRLSSAEAALHDPTADLALDEHTLFQGSRHIDTGSVNGQVQLHDIGMLAVSSGVLAISDFGYDLAALRPLSRRAPSGHHRVQTVTLDQRVAGIRVCFAGDRRAVKWKAATCEGGNGIYGVDAGNLAIFDVSGLDGLSRIDQERHFRAWAEDDAARTLTLARPDDGVITPSGYGDGAYPAFWGLDDTDTLVSLYIDFMILVEETGDGRFVSI